MIVRHLNVQVWSYGERDEKEMISAINWKIRERESQREREREGIKGRIGSNKAIIQSCIDTEGHS